MNYKYSDYLGVSKFLYYDFLIFVFKVGVNIVFLSSFYCEERGMFCRVEIFVVVYNDSFLVY